MALRAVVFLLIGFVSPVLGQERSLELGLRYWLSGGETVFAHNAQGANPAFGNPTSILTYDELDAHALEVFVRSNFGNGWFLRSTFGVGGVKDGSLDDEDYDAGQVKSSDTTSTVRGDRLSYFSLDIGRDLWSSAGGATVVGAYAGFQHWSETLEAFGAMASVGTINVPDGVLAISNEVVWNSLRVGVTGRMRVGEKTTFMIDFALIPFSDVRNEDSHYLRADLGPVPNVITNGRGAGAQLDLEVRHRVYRRTELGIGVRYWRLRASDADVAIAGIIAPVTEFETRRAGITASVMTRW